MGMFDEIICDYQLPGTPPAFVKKGDRFQTKDLACTLAVYTIGEDGRLTPDCEDFTGSIEFGASNIKSWNPLATENGEDAESIEYAAFFEKGQLTKILETERTKEPAIPHAVTAVPMRRHSPTDEDVARWRAREAESLIGRAMYVKWGTGDGYWVEVIAESPRHWCLRRRDNGDLELFDRRMRGGLLFDSEAESVAHDADRRADREQRQAQQDRQIAEYKARKERKPDA